VTRRLLTMTVVLGSIGAWGCTPEKKEHVAQKGVEEEKALKAENAKASPPPQIMPNTHVAAGKMLERQGDFNGAIAQYERAVASEPRCTTAYNRLGIVYQKIGRYADAENIFKQGANADLTSAALLNNLGYCYLVQKKLPEAEQAFRDALDRSQDFQRSRMNLAIVLAQSGRLDESLIEFSHVVPADAAHYNLAMICLQRRDYANAEKSLREALTINPDCRGARDQLRHVTQLAASSSPEAAATVTPVSPLAGKVEDEASAVAP
jgi:Flp pilus assembly protein TadD